MCVTFGLQFNFSLTSHSPCSGVVFGSNLKRSLPILGGAVSAISSDLNLSFERVPHRQIRVLYVSIKSLQALSHYKCYSQSHINHLPQSVAQNELPSGCVHFVPDSSATINDFILKLYIIYLIA